MGRGGVGFASGFGVGGSGGLRGILGLMSYSESVDVLNALAM